MPKVETFLKRNEIEEIENRAKEANISRSACIRAAVLYSIKNYDFDRWLKDNKDKLEK